MSATLEAFRLVAGRACGVRRAWGARLVAAALGCALVGLLGVVVVARADQPVAADSLLGRYLDTLADSTNAHFGELAAPIDTTGLDSARVFALDHPERWGYRKRRALSLHPVFDFNRVDGPVMGLGAGLGKPHRWGKLSGDWAWAAGPNLVLGHASYLKSRRRDNERWDLSLWGGRATPAMDREYERNDLLTLGSFISGRGREHFVRQDGVVVGLSREGQAHRLTARYRDELESPLVTTATWNLRHKRPEVIDNLPARFGRARELEYELLWRVPKSPVTAQLEHATSSHSINSDFEYRRTRAVLGADLAIGRVVALVPQVEYGALTGEFTPQTAFTLGGVHTLRSIPYGTVGGSRLALAKLDVIMVRDVFELLHLPMVSPVPVQLAAFGAVGAAWGRDPYTGLVRPGLDWPNAADWRKEVGVAVMFQPGIPDPALFVRFNWARPVGPSDTGDRFTLSIGRGLDRMGKFGGLSKRDGE